MSFPRRLPRLVFPALLGHLGSVLLSVSLLAQAPTAPSGLNFELSSVVQIDAADAETLALLERTKTYLADKKGEEGIATLRQISENAEDKWMKVADNRYVGLREYCQRRFATLPPDVLKLYRIQIDPAAKKWYDEGTATRNHDLLLKVVEEAFASRWGDDALLALGDLALENGQYAAARGYWERIVPPPANPTAKDASPSSSKNQPDAAWANYPDTDLDLASVRARLVLVSILEGSLGRARDELLEFTHLHGEARGMLGGRNVNYAEALKTILSESSAESVVRSRPEWPTFAGDPQRNGIWPDTFDGVSVAWRLPLPKVPRSTVRANMPAAALAPLSYYPVYAEGAIFIATQREILAVRAATGKPWKGSSPILYQDPLSAINAGLTLPQGTLGVPRYTLTIHDGLLFALLGSGIVEHPQMRDESQKAGAVVCLDLKAEGRLLWKLEPEPGWAFEGTPIADAVGVYAIMQRQDVHPQSFLACFEPRSGKLKWRKLICSAETPARGMLFRCSHNVPTLVGDTIYVNTNLGAVAALRTTDGRPLWLTLYPRERSGNLAQMPYHWARDANPCLFSHSTLYIIPRDTPRLLAFDAADGQILWQSPPALEDAVQMLGASEDFLIASGGKIYWLGLKGLQLGRVKHYYPEGPERVGVGRGEIAASLAVFPIEDRILMFDIFSSLPKKSIDLKKLDVEAGNVLIVEGGIAIASEKELVFLKP